MIDFIVNVFVLVIIINLFVEMLCGFGDWQTGRKNRKYRELVKKVRGEL